MSPQPFSVSFVRPHPFGTVAAVALPSGTEPVDDSVVQRLAPGEQALARSLRGRRQIEFTGGRLAYRALRPDGPALLTGTRGEPACPAGLMVSLTHKTELAVALVTDASLGAVGIDLEGDGRARLGIAERVLRPEELAEVNALPEAERWPAVLLRFAIKEATYKAINGRLQRFVGFHEAAVTLIPMLGVTLFPKPGEPELRLECHWEQLGLQVLASVRARP